MSLTTKQCEELRQSLNRAFRKVGHGCEQRGAAMLTALYRTLPTYRLDPLGPDPLAKALRFAAIYGRRS